MRYHGEVFKGRDGWRWRIVSRNGRKVACSGEAFSDRTAARRAFVRFVETFGVAAVRIK